MLRPLGGVRGTPHGRGAPRGVIRTIPQKASGGPAPAITHTAPPAPGGVEALWNGVLYGYSGYAKANREILKRVALSASIRAADDAPWNPSENDPDILALQQRHRAVQVSEKAPRITFLPPQDVAHPGYRVIYTMMETEKIHPDMIRVMNERYDECWVPTQWNKGTFQRSGLKLPVHVMPLGVDTSIYTPAAPPFVPQATLLTGPNAGQLELPKGFLFISVFQPSFRKGHDVLIKAFEEAFAGDPAAGLVLGTTAYSMIDIVPWKHMKSRIWALQGGYSESQLASIYRGCKAYVCASRGEGWNLPLCLVEGTEVDTLNGPVPIERITPGVVVTDHTGADALVEGVTHREYEGEVISIKRYGDTNKIVSDPLHPHLILKRPFKRFGPSLRAIQRGDVKPQWVKAGEVSKGDFMCVPKLFPLSKEFISPLVLTSTIDGLTEAGEGKVSVPSSYSIKGHVTLKTVAKELGVGFKQVSKILNHGRNNPGGNPYSQEHVDHVTAVAKRLGYERPSPVSVSNVISMTKDVAFFFGLYIAEGCALDEDRGINITLYKDETWAADLCEKVLRDEFQVNPHRLINGNKIIIKVSSTVLGKAFQKLFGKGARNKHIPNEWKRNDFVREIVSGIFYGDGCYHRVGVGKYSFSTYSHRLCSDLLEIMNRCGILASPVFGRGQEVNINIPAQYDAKFYREFYPRKHYSKCLPRDKARYTHVPEDGVYFYPIVRSVTKSPFKGTLRNLHVSHGNSFTIRGAATHNCEAGAVGLPVIVPRTSTHPELVPPGLGYFFDKDSDRVFEEGKQFSPWFDGIEFPDYGDKSRAQLVELMRRVKKNYAEAAMMGQKFKDHVTSKLTWDIAAKKVVGRLREICGGNDV